MTTKEKDDLRKKLSSLQGLLKSLQEQTDIVFKSKAKQIHLGEKITQHSSSKVFSDSKEDGAKIILASNKRTRSSKKGTVESKKINANLDNKDATESKKEIVNLDESRDPPPGSRKTDIMIKFNKHFDKTFDGSSELDSSLKSKLTIEDSNERLLKLAKEVWKSKGNQRVLHSSPRKPNSLSTSESTAGNLYHSMDDGSNQIRKDVIETTTQHGTKKYHVAEKHWNSISSSNHKILDEAKTKNESRRTASNCTKISTEMGEKKIKPSSTQTIKSLKCSSDKLSLLARETWKKSLSTSKMNPTHRHYTQGHSDVSSGMVLQNKNTSYVTNFGSKKPAKEENEFTPMAFQVDRKLLPEDHLSKLARNVWKQKMNSERHKRFVKANSRMKRTARQTVNINEHGEFHLQRKANGYKWVSRKRQSASFLYRRKHVILRNSRFKIVRSSYVIKKEDENVPSTHVLGDGRQWKSKYSYNKKKTTFISRRQAFLFRHSHGSRRWLSSQNRHITSSFQTNATQKKPRKDLKEPRVLFTSISGKKFVSDVKGRRLRRVSSSTSNLMQSFGIKDARPGNATILQSEIKQRIINSPSRYKVIRRQSSATLAASKLAASRVVKKRLARIHQQNIRKFVKKQYCMFYNRFGKCKNGDRCKYVHDAEKVAVCTRFLRGTCKDQNCLFSHTVDKSKMPTCSFFLSGCCHRDDCPYAHVKVSGSAEVCKDFLRGYCAMGEKCLKRHMLECEEFKKSGTCSEGKSCKLHHRKQLAKKRRSSSLSGTKTPKPFAKKIKIGVTKDDIVISTEPKNKELQIKPSFTGAHDPDRQVIGRSRLQRKRRFDWKTEVENKKTLGQSKNLED